MKTYNLTKKQTEVVDALEDAGFPATWWGRGELAERIYFQELPMTHKAYITFDNPSALEGAALKIHIKDCGKPTNWYLAQKEILKDRLSEAFQIVTGRKASEQNPKAITEKQAEELAVGATVEFITGGEGESNAERALVGVVKKVSREPAPAGTIGQTEQVVVILEDSAGEFALYTWRGFLRYGSGAQIVRQNKSY